MQAGFEDDLRQTDLGGHAEPLVDRAPLREEGAILAGVGQQRVATRAIVQYRPSRSFEEKRHLLSPFTQFARERLTVEDAGDRWIDPHRFARPRAFGGERREQPPVNGAAEGDGSVGAGEDVLPERIAGPERLHGGEVGAPARLDGADAARHVRRRRGGDRPRSTGA